jgi:glycosyltransferase involved in cell wall biosynthesis
MDEVKKKNYILINSLGGGGAERQVSLISTLNEIDKIILLEPIITYDIPKEKLIFLSNSPNSILQKALLLFTISSKLKKIGVDKNANLFCFLQLSYILGLIAKFVLKCKFIICIRTSPFGFYEQYKGLKIPFFIYKFILKKADKIICNSKTSELQLKEKLNLNQAVTISNGYNIGALQSLSKESLGEFDTLFNSNKVLITVGRLLHDKGQWHLIRIYHELLKKEKNIKLVILGEGPLLVELIGLCNKLNLTSFNYLKDENPIEKECDVYFLGFQRNPYKFVSKSYLFLLSSLYEGLPNVVLESLIINTPCVLSDCNSGPKEILLPESDLLKVSVDVVKSEYGYLIPPFDGIEKFNTTNLNKTELQWVHTIQNLIPNSSLYLSMKSNSKTYILEYEMSKVQLKWKAFFK